MQEMQAGNLKVIYFFMIRLKEKYQKEVMPAMQEKFGYENKMAIPRIEKITINTSYGKEITSKTSAEQKRFIESILEDLSLISGQKAVKTYAKKAISTFKTRKGMPVGAKVNLRGERMMDFLERFIHLVLPRTRDFRGISSKSIDEQGNLTVAIKEHIAFPEISPEKIKNIFSLEITIVTRTKNKQESLELFKLLGLPIK